MEIVEDNVLDCSCRKRSIIQDLSYEITSDELRIMRLEKEKDGEIYLQACSLLTKILALL